MLLYAIDCCLSIFTLQSSIIKVQNFLITLTCFSDSTHRHHTQIHTPTVVQAGRGAWMEPLPGVF